MNTKMNQKQIDWLLTKAIEEADHRQRAYPSMRERGKLKGKDAVKYKLRWSFICRLLKQASRDNYGKDTARPIVLKMEELTAAIVEAKREHGLRKRYYTDATKEGEIKLGFCKHLIIFLEEQESRKRLTLGVQTDLFNIK